MSRTNRLFSMLVIPALLLGPVGAAASAGPGEGGTDEPPTVEEISALVGGRCGQLLQWELDALGETVGLVWRANYARCALQAVEDERIIERIRDNRTLEEHGLGPQFAALVEACAYVNAVYLGQCSYKQFLEPFGVEAQNLDCNAPPSAPHVVDPNEALIVESAWASEAGAAANSCDPIQVVKDALCRSGICLDRFIGVRHSGAAWNPDTGACSGVKVETSVTAGASGIIITTGIFTYWRAKGSGSAQNDVTWEFGCEVLADLIGQAWGGFMRQLIIRRPDVEYSACHYDGLAEMDCTGTWQENVVATGNGAYKHTSQEGDPPIPLMRVQTRSGGHWSNEGYGTSYGITILDSVAAVLSAGSDYLVHYDTQTPAQVAVPGPSQLLAVVGMERPN